jgi:death-on-curing protein
MRAEPRWINKTALVLLHDESLALFGGASGLRDEGLLDSALGRPINQHLYIAGTDTAALAAAYGHGLAKNHPFVDGNKRAAFLAIGLFLHLNGQRLRASQVDAIQTILALAAGHLSEGQLADWIRANLAP